MCLGGGIPAGCLTPHFILRRTRRGASVKQSCGGTATTRTTVVAADRRRRRRMSTCMLQPQPHNIHSINDFAADRNNARGTSAGRRPSLCCRGERQGPPAEKAVPKRGHLTHTFTPHKSLFRPPSGRQDLSDRNSYSVAETTADSRLVGASGSWPALSVAPSERVSFSQRRIDDRRYVTIRASELNARIR